MGEKIRQTCRKIREVKMFRIARVGLHHYEEPCISGDRGSGTVFFSGCNLRCKFCQNYEISRGGKGIEVDGCTLLKLFEYLAEEGAHNINLVTPTLYVNALIPVLRAAKEILRLPIVWNSSGYETVANIKKLEGLVDIYLPDFKYSDDDMAYEYSHAKGYSAVARAAISEMRRQQPKDVFDEEGMLLSGVVVRHLVLPGGVKNARGVFENIAAIDRNTYVSVMGQYFPTPAVEGDALLGRRISDEEYDDAIEAFFDAGLKNGFSQSLDSATKEYVPEFDTDALEKLIERLKK